MTLWCCLDLQGYRAIAKPQTLAFDVRRFGADEV